MRVRVLSYNIHKCIGGIDRRYRPQRVADTIGHYEPDFVLLQEVDSGAKRSNHDHQRDLLGDMLNLRHRTWFPNHALREGGAYGNAILSRFPLTYAHNIDLTMPGRKRRGVVHARFRIRGNSGARTRTVHVFNLHLGLLERDRRGQLARFLASNPFTHLHQHTPIIVAGDFNDVWGSVGDLLVPAGFTGMPRRIPTFPAYAPVRALDSIFVRGDISISAVRRGRTALARQASDHLPLVADLEIPTRGGKPSRPASARA